MAEEEAAKRQGELAGAKQEPTIGPEGTTPENSEEPGIVERIVEGFKSIF